MLSQGVTARFSTPEEMEKALCDLRRLGAVSCLPTLETGRWKGPGVLHFTVSPARLSMARAVVIRAGGKLIARGRGIVSP